VGWAMEVDTIGLFERGSGLLNYNRSAMVRRLTTNLALAVEIQLCYK
jgi:hypothetical protein